MKRRVLIVMVPLILILVTTCCIKSNKPNNYVANRKELTWLKNNCIQIKTVNAGNGFEDLQPLKKIIGSSRIVGLGEFSHGSKEVFQMKHRIVEFLVSEMGFNIFSMETNMPEASKLNDYVQNGEGDPRAILNSGDWIWNNQEILNMVEWMRKINSNGCDKIQFTGFDMQLISGALENIEKYSNLHDKNLKSQIDSLKNTLSKAQLLASQNGNINGIVLKINKTSKGIVSYFEKNKNSITGSIKESEYQWLMQNANIMVQSTLKGKRDSCMAENVTWLLNRRPDAKIILWAHNQHVSKDPLFLGGFLSQKYGTDYFNIGFLSNSGSFNASTSEGITSNIMEDSKPGSIEYSFHKTRIPIFLFDFSCVNKSVPESHWLSKELNTRFIGSYIRKDSMILLQKIARCYNSVIYIDSTHASTFLGSN
jgi:erythromycin esterase